MVLLCGLQGSLHFKSGKRERGHIPFRDKASQALMKKMHDRDAEGDQEEIGSQGGRSHGTQEEPEGEPGLNITFSIKSIILLIV